MRRSLFAARAFFRMVNVSSRRVLRFAEMSAFLHTGKWSFFRTNCWIASFTTDQ